MSPAIGTTEPSIGNVLNRLDRVKRTSNGWSASCPAAGHEHEDRTPSLSVRVDGDRILLKCHKGHTTEEIVAARGMTLADLFLGSLHRNGSHADVPPPSPPTSRPRKGEQLVAIYQYTDGKGNILAEKGRFELADLDTDGKRRKTFRWRLPGGEAWTGLMGALSQSDLALWGAESISSAASDAWIYFVEGERAAEACRTNGLTAVTFAGGASARDFGTALETLQGKRVALWPDNDVTGREYMAFVQGRIQAIAAEVRLVNVPLPKKGDAVEWFAAGGSVADLESMALRLDGPSVEYHGADQLVVRVPSATGTITFRFDELEKKARGLDAELTIEIDAPGADRSPYSERINLLSFTARTELRRELESIYGKEFGWTKLLNSVFSLTRERFLGYDRSVDAYDITALDEKDLFFHNPLIVRDAVNVLFGDRGSTKSYVAKAIVFSAAIGEPFLQQTMPVGPALYVDYEDSERNWRRRLERVALGMNLPVLPGLVQYLNLVGMPMVDAARFLRKKIIAEGISLVVVDSLGAAVAGTGDPSSAEVAIAVMQALRSLGTTVIALAHVPKGQGVDQPKDPFGSVFYSNLARRTWYVEKVQEEASDQIDVGFYCKKVNDGPLPPPIALQVEFVGLSGTVTIREVAMATVPKLQERRPLKNQIWDALAQSKTVKDLIATILPAGADDAEEKRLTKATLYALRDGKHFAKMGQANSSVAGGRPADIWGRAAQSSFSSLVGKP